MASFGYLRVDACRAEKVGDPIEIIWSIVSCVMVRARLRVFCAGALVSSITSNIGVDITLGDGAASACTLGCITISRGAVCFSATLGNGVSSSSSSSSLM